MDANVDHIVGTVMRKTRGLGSKHGNQANYDIVWEYSALGETNVPYSHLLEANKVADKLMKSRSKMKGGKQKVGIANLNLIKANLCTMSDDEEEIIVSKNVSHVMVIMV